MFNNSQNQKDKFNSDGTRKDPQPPSSNGATNSHSGGGETSGPAGTPPDSDKSPASGSRRSARTGLDFRTRHPFETQAELALLSIAPRYAANVLSELEALSNKTSSARGAPVVTKESEELSNMASDLGRAMPRYRAAHMAEIAKQYQKMNFFDAAVFERISFEIKLGGADLDLRATDVVQILKAAAHLRADAWMAPDRLAEFTAPLVKAMNHLLPGSISRDTNWLISMDELVDCATALSILSPSDAGKFAQFAMIRCTGNLSPKAVADLLPVLLVTGENKLDSMITRCLSMKKLTREQKAALQAISDALGYEGFQCEVKDSTRVLPSGVPVAGTLKVKDLNSNVTHEIDLDTTTQRVVFVSNRNDHRVPSGGDTLRTRAFANQAAVAARAPEANTNPSPLVLNLPATLVADLAADPKSIEGRLALERVLDTLSELFLRSEQAMEMKASA